MRKRENPNLFIAGAPGVGKTELTNLLSKCTTIMHLDVNKMAIENGALDHEFDARYELPPINDMEVMTVLKDALVYGDGNVVDYYSPSLFPIDGDTFDGIFVLNCDESVLYKRLRKRNYDVSLLEHVLNLEHFNVALCEARDIYAKPKIMTLDVTYPFQRIDAVESILWWINDYKERRMEERRNDN